MANNKYQRMVRQVSYDGGLTWTNVEPPQYKKGILLEENSTDCNFTPCYNSWFLDSTDNAYICKNGTKYQRLILRESCDGGNTWTDSNPPEYSTGNIIEMDAPDCNK